jgi:hypothetical protein
MEGHMNCTLIFDALGADIGTSSARKRKPRLGAGFSADSDGVRAEDAVS